MRLSQQEIINAICLNMAARKGLKPTDIEVELMWDEDLGYSAKIYFQGREQILIEANMLEAIGQYVLNEYQMRVFHSQIRLDIDDDLEEMVAEIAV
jgi:hypothetical protein